MLLGGKAKKDGLPIVSINDVLSGIGEKIEKNPLLKEVYNRDHQDFNDLIEKYSGEKVMMAVQLVESYKLLLEINKNCEG